MIQWYEGDNGILIYTNTRTKQVVHVWEEDLDAIADICEDWKSTIGDRLANKDYSYRSLVRALGALQRVQHTIDAGHGADVDGDDYLDLSTAIDDLNGIVRRIAQIA